MNINLIIAAITFLIGIGIAYFSFQSSDTYKKLSKNQKIFRWTITIISMLTGIGFFLYIA